MVFSTFGLDILGGLVGVLYELLSKLQGNTYVYCVVRLEVYELCNACKDRSRKYSGIACQTEHALLANKTGYPLSAHLDLGQEALEAVTPHEALYLCTLAS